MAASCFTQTKTKWDGAGGGGKGDQRKRRRKVWWRTRGDKIMIAQDWRFGRDFLSVKGGGKGGGGGGWRFGRDLLSVQAGGGEASEGKDSGSDAVIMQNAIGDHGDNLEWSWWLALTHWCNLNNWGGKDGTLTLETGGTVWILVWRVWTQRLSPVIVMIIVIIVMSPSYRLL